MRKILFIINVTLALVFFSASAKAEIDTSKIDESTSIESDLSLMNLTYKDYQLSQAKYDVLKEEYLENDVYEQYVIAVAENYGKDTLQTYVYCYSPLMFYKDINVQLDITLNNQSSSQFQYNNAFKNMELVKSDEIQGIVVFSLELYKLTNFVRSYKIDINDSGMDTFECNYRTTTDNKDRCDSFNYNSLIYIDDDSIYSVRLNSTLKFDSFWNSVKDSFTGLNGSSVDPVLNFYNFSSSKKIDTIISANVKFSYDTFKDSDFMIGTDKKELIETKENVKRIIQPGIYTYDWGKGLTAKFDYFKTPCSDRFPTSMIDTSEFYTLNNIKKDDFCLSKKTGKLYQHSILFDVSKYTHQVGMGYEINTYSIVKDFRLTKLVYETDGVIYNSFAVDPDGPDDGDKPDDGNKPENPFEEFKKWLIEQFDKFSGWIKTNASSFFWVIFGIILAIIFGIGLVKFGFKVILQMIWWLIKLPFVIVWSILTVPFSTSSKKGGKKNG